jgi:hypothetical protein
MRTSSSHAEQIIYVVMPRFLQLLPKLARKGSKGYALPDGTTFKKKEDVFGALCPGLGSSSFFNYQALWTNKESEPTRKFLRGELRVKDALTELSALGLMKNTRKRKGAGDGGKDGTKKQKRGGGGGGGGGDSGGVVPFEMVVEALRLLGTAVDEGGLVSVEAFERYVERLRAERGGAQEQGQQVEELQGLPGHLSEPGPVRARAEGQGPKVPRCPEVRALRARVGRACMRGQDDTGAMCARMG